MIPGGPSSPVASRIDRPGGDAEQGEKSKLFAPASLGAVATTTDAPVVWAYAKAGRQRAFTTEQRPCFAPLCVLHSGPQFRASEVELRQSARGACPPAAVALVFQGEVLASLELGKGRPRYLRNALLNRVHKNDKRELQSF